MDYLKFLGSAYKVQTVIGLLAFVIAALLGYWAYISVTRLRRIAGIMEKADTETKANLAIALMEVMPAYRIPDINTKQGFALAKLQLRRRGAEFNARVKLLRLGMVLFFVLVLGVIGKSLVAFSHRGNTINATTSGKESPIMIGNGNKVDYSDDTTKPKKDSVK